jgi:hypothetical protein
MVKGLAPKAGYNLSAGGATATISPGGSTMTDSAGVLVASL